MNPEVTESLQIDPHKAILALSLNSISFRFFSAAHEKRGSTIKSYKAQFSPASYITTRARTEQQPIYD